MSRLRMLPVFIVLGAGLIAGCGGSSKQALDLSPEAAAGQAIAERSCGGCHTTNGRASSGPSWQGLAGSQVELSDGTTVTADDAYLTRSIMEPGADIVEGYADTMSSAFPAGSFTDEQAAQLVAYINALAAPTQP